MDRVINIDINDKHDLFEPYNDNFLHQDLISYLLRHSATFKKGDKVTIEIDNNVTKKRHFESIMKQSLKKEQLRLCEQQRLMNRKQLIWFGIGCMVMVLSYFLTTSALKEILMVVGSVPIWEAISIEIFKDTEVRKKIHTIDILLDATVKGI